MTTPVALTNRTGQFDQAFRARCTTSPAIVSAFGTEAPFRAAIRASSSVSRTRRTTDEWE